MNKQRIAIVGSGISGLTVAYLLHEQHEVSLLEANDYIGGHTHTVPVRQADREHRVDTGFIVCNDRNYPNFLKLMSRLKLELQPTEMSFSVRNDRLGLEYNGHNINTLFAQRCNIPRPRFYRLLGDILRFNRAARHALHDGGPDELSLDEFAQQQSPGPLFRDNYLRPMAAAIWSCSPEQAGRIPARFFFAFSNHGLLDLRNRPRWYVLKGGSSTYIVPLTASFRNRIHLDTAVHRIQRQRDGIVVEHARGRDTFDQVILACHSDQALRLLADPHPAEAVVLGGLPYQQNEVILHNDVSLMPRCRRAWASWNVLVGTGDDACPPVVTYCMNILQGITSQRPLLVSLNARERIAPDQIIRTFNYSHPLYTRRGMNARARRGEICGVDRIHYCGAYWYNGFHEDGVRSALDVGQRFGGVAVKPATGGEFESAIYQGRVRHCRFSPVRHEFDYALTLFFLKLDEIPRINAAFRCLGTGFGAWARFRREDYLPGSDDLAVAVKEKIRELLGRPLGSISGEVFFLGQLRHLGCYFSPLNLYFLKQDGKFRYMLAEVSNTPWNERHYYLVDLEGPQAQRKEFHVSPFNPMRQTYRWRIRPPGADRDQCLVGLAIYGYADPGRKVFQAILNLQRKPLNQKEINRVLIKTPLPAVSVLFGIYRQALSLFLKRAPLYRHPGKTPG